MRLPPLPGERAQEAKMARRAARIDNNQTEIVKALRDAGCLVWVTSEIGHGFPDLLVCANWARNAELHMIEVKSPGGKLTADEMAVFAIWPVHLVFNVVEALAVVGLQGIAAQPSEVCG